MFKTFHIFNLNILNNFRLEEIFKMHLMLLYINLSLLQFETNRQANTFDKTFGNKNKNKVVICSGKLKVDKNIRV